MPEFGGLQIEVRCVKCGRLPTADITLFEMQNHLYICNICRQGAEQQGKHIAWVSGVQMEPLVTASASSASPTIPLSPVGTRSLTARLPPDSLFAVLELPLETPISKIGETIKQHMSVWMKQPDSPEKKQMIARLREWREELQDEQAFEERRNNLKSFSRREGGALSLGGRSVLTAQEFLDACEASREGWADGERYLRTGQLRQWILFQLGDRDLAIAARRYQTWTSVSDFRALNEMLFCLVPERSFRLYSEEKWQALANIPKAATAEELATLCDIHWNIGENHLYAGSMVFWLEHCRGIRELTTYYTASIAGYANTGADRGVGLELLLERAMPKLPRPKLVVAFDGNVGSYTLNRWDREVPHKPISVTITNTTRGFTSVDLALQLRPSMAEPDWITMYTDTSTPLRGRPGAGMPATKTLTLMNLPQLSRGRKYQRELSMAVRGEFGQPPAVEKFPITLRTMWFFQGLRGILWRWGLRGGLPGLFWNFAMGALLAFLPFLLIPTLVPNTYLYQSTNEVSFSSFLQETVAGTVAAFQFLGLQFPLIVGAILGFAGFWVGIGKGHTDYLERLNSAAFRKWTFWLSLAFAIVLLFWDHGSDAISQAFQYGGNYYYGSSSILTAFLFGGGSVIIGFLIFLIACIVAFIRHRLEKFLRKRYEALLHPAGRA